MHWYVHTYVRMQHSWVEVEEAGLINVKSPLDVRDVSTSSVYLQVRGCHHRDSNKLADIGDWAWGTKSTDPKAFLSQKVIERRSRSSQNSWRIVWRA